MIEDAYPYFPLGDNLFWGFRSEGIKGIIPKIVFFTLTKEGKWNLAFGDWKNNDVDDKVMSNNQDIVRVIGTVAKITDAFFDYYPDAIVVIKPVDEKRKRLYNIVFQRHYAFMKDKFQIDGLKNDLPELYSPKETYDIFELSLKSKYRK